MYKKNPQTKSVRVQCLADFLIKVAGRFFSRYTMQLNTCSYVNKIIQRKVQPLHPRFGKTTNEMSPYPSPVENQRKFKKNQYRIPSAIVFLALGTWFNQVPWRAFFSLKSSFSKNSKIGGKVEFLKPIDWYHSHRTWHTSFPSHFTVPLPVFCYAF